MVLDNNHHYSNSSNSNSSNDITVRCRVRRNVPVNETTDPTSMNDALHNTNGTNSNGCISPNKTTFIEMTCTMRNWDSHHPTTFYSSSYRSSSSSCNHKNTTNRNRSSSASAADTLQQQQQQQQQQASLSSLIRNSLLFTKSADTETRDHNVNNDRSNPISNCMDGPELYFVPIYSGGTNDISPCKSSRLLFHSSTSSSRHLSSSSLHVSPKLQQDTLLDAEQPYNIPVAEIRTITIYDNKNTKQHNRSTIDKAFIIEIITISLDYYEIDCLTTNAYDILFTCLQTKLVAAGPSHLNDQIIVVQNVEQKKKKKKLNRKLSSKQRSPKSAKNRSNALASNNDDRTVDSTSVTTTATNDNSTTASTNSYIFSSSNDHKTGEKTKIVTTASTTNTSIIEEGGSGTTGVEDIMDTLQAQQFAKTRTQSETVYDTILRKYQYIVSNLSDQWQQLQNHNSNNNNVDGGSTTPSDSNSSLCCCTNDTTNTSTMTSNRNNNNNNKNNSNSSSSSNFDLFCCGGVEFESFSMNSTDPDTINASYNHENEKSNQHNGQRNSQLSPLLLPSHNNQRMEQSHCSHNHGNHHNANTVSTKNKAIPPNRAIVHMPSGLSVEPADPYDIESVR